jgi:hypothetical protein
MLPAKIKNAASKMNQKHPPLWKGPQVDGITFSLLSRFLACRDRFKVLVIDGLGPAPIFDQKLGYGNMWHECEAALAANEPWRVALQEYCRKEARKYPTQGFEIKKWYNVCQQQFPIYVDYWAKHPDVKFRTPLYQELPFEVPYTLPSGRTVIIRGKFDSVDIIGKKRDEVWLQENKSKGDINEEKLKKQLKFDLQTMMYIIALRIARSEGILDIGPPITGVRYNVIRRPLAGGKHSIRQHKPTKSNPAGESETEYYNRLGGLIREEAAIATKEKKDCFYFMRWNVPITDADVKKFEDTCLIPVLEQLCDWYAVICGHAQVYQPWNYHHYRFPYGVWNATLEGRSTAVDDYLDTGSRVGLVRVESLFSELTDAEASEADTNGEEE